MQVGACQENALSPSYSQCPRSVLSTCQDQSERGGGDVLFIEWRLQRRTIFDNLRKHGLFAEYEPESEGRDGWETLHSESGQRHPGHEDLLAN